MIHEVIGSSCTSLYFTRVVNLQLCIITKSFYYDCVVFVIGDIYSQKPENFCSASQSEDASNSSVMKLKRTRKTNQ